VVFKLFLVVTPLQKFAELATHQSQKRLACNINLLFTSIL